MSVIKKILENKLIEAKKEIYDHLNKIVSKRLSEAKKYIASDMLEIIEVLDEAAPKRNPNIIKMGKVQRIRRRIRRNAKGRIVVQKNARRSSIKGFRIAGKGNVIRRIPTIERLRKARLLKRSWKTTRRAKIRRTLMKRKMSMRRRASIGLR
jgi:hypothetical protein